MSTFGYMTPSEKEAIMSEAWKKRGLDKFISIRSFDSKVSKDLKAIAGVPMYYPVSFDAKGRQYMGGYPLSPQGSKETRPLFVPAEDYKCHSKALVYIKAEAAEMFGDVWDEIEPISAELVEAGYLSPATISACTTKGKPDIAKLAVLREYVALCKIVKGEK